MLAFDAAASVASVALQFPYQYASVGSALIYVAFTFLAARKFGFWRGVLMGAALGCVDATLGWAISWAIGPGRVPPEQISLGIWAFTLASVVGIGTICGLIGAGMGALTRKSPRAA